MNNKSRHFQDKMCNCILPIWDCGGQWLAKNYKMAISWLEWPKLKKNIFHFVFFNLKSVHSFFIICIFLGVNSILFFRGCKLLLMQITCRKQQNRNTAFSMTKMRNKSSKQTFEVKDTKAVPFFSFWVIYLRYGHSVVLWRIIGLCTRSLILVKCSYTFAGRIARLSVESKAGKATVSLHLDLGDPPPPPY